MRRFLLHVLPDGFHRIRHYGFLANGRRAASLALCRHLLQAPAPAPPEPTEQADWRDHLQQLTGVDVRLCRCCGGLMLSLGPIPRRPFAAQPCTPDTS